MASQIPGEADVVDVLVIGAGPSGAVVTHTAAAAGLSVVCLEQGDWVNPSDFPANFPEWELLIQHNWAHDPNVRGLPSDYPVDVEDSDMWPVMFNAVGGSSIYYGAEWPRLLPSDFRVKTLDGVADDWPISYHDLKPYHDEVDEFIGVAGVGGDTAYPEGLDYPLPPHPMGKPGIKAAQAVPAITSPTWLAMSSVPWIVIDSVAIRTSGLVPPAVVPAGLTENTRNTTEVGMVIVVPAMMHSGGPLACADLVQPPGVTFALLIGVAPDSMTAAVGATGRCCRSGGCRCRTRRRAVRRRCRHRCQRLRLARRADEAAARRLAGLAGRTAGGGRFAGHAAGDRVEHAGSARSAYRPDRMEVNHTTGPYGLPITLDRRR